MREKLFRSRELSYTGRVMRRGLCLVSATLRVRIQPGTVDREYPRFEVGIVDREYPGCEAGIVDREYQFELLVR